MGILSGALRDDIADIYFFNIWMCLKQRYKIAGKVAAADDCNRDFFATLSNSLQKCTCIIQASGPGSNGENKSVL